VLIHCFERMTMPFDDGQVGTVRLAGRGMLSLQLNRSVIRGKRKRDGNFTICFEVVQCLLAGRERDAQADLLLVFRNTRTPGAR
jgi:hypothetical protein